MAEQSEHQYLDEVDAGIEPGIQLAVPQKIRPDSDIVSHIAIRTGPASQDLDMLGMPHGPPCKAFRRFNHRLRIDAELLVLEPIDCLFSRVGGFDHSTTVSYPAGAGLPATRAALSTFECEHMPLYSKPGQVQVTSPAS